MREYFEVNRKLEPWTLQNIALLANTGYKYLPDNLQNQNRLRELLIDIQKGVKTPENEILYSEIVKSLADYLENVEIQEITGTISANPNSGNAPLTVTFRAGVQDPSGTQILPGNYTWWVDSAGKKVVIGRGPSINFTFKEEGRYSVFLDVTSSHKNAEWYTDVLPFRSRADVVIQEKIASLIINIDGDRVEDNEVLKFTPDDASYGLLFDASSSTPTGGAQFVRTSWDFWNGATRTYNGPPKIERVRYATEGDYDVRLRLETNEGKVVERFFSLIIRDPIARIESNRDDGFIWDSFTFSAKSSGLERNLSYNWEIIDIENDTVITQKSDKVLTYVFTKKWKYNVRLKVRQSSWEVDQDSYIVYVTSQAPIAAFSSTIPLAYKPNRVFLDASRTHDPDFSDDGNLKYDWFIDGERVSLEDANSQWSTGYYTFDSIGTHSVNLEVTDPDGIVDIKKWDVTINSILSVEMQAFPRVIQRGGFIRFEVDSPEAEVYEWNFGDGKTSGGSSNTITHSYEKSGTFNVQVKVTDGDNKTNTYNQTVYVSESNQPLANAVVSFGTFESPLYDEQACQWKWAYVVDRVNTIRFDASDSINIDGSQTWLEYSWKIGPWKFANSANISHRFDEIGCFPIKLTVKSATNGKTDVTETMVDVRNLDPIMTSVSIDIENPEQDPLIVRVTAQWAKDPDGVIQSYLWYYYTDIDPEPQDFRSTATASTAFVIPKITGNYYFVAILKDNNESRVSSEDITGSRFFTTITGDNINTPIIELWVNDNSTVIGEEIIFTAKAQNILGQSIEKDASFSWDFDGDGFYDTQTSEPSTSYVYRKSGEFFAKVKVKYRGISSTKNVTVNVSNKLVPDFGYISVGNTFIFFDSSTGQVDTRQWDLGDGTIKTGTNFSHTYTDKVTSHTVTLKISEGTKVKEVQKKVTKNIKNILKTKKSDFVGFSFPDTDESGNITLESPSEKVFVYMWEWSESWTRYAIDYDIESDSDLNWWTDDDEDNVGTASYNSWDVTEIPLNEYKTQTIRLFTKSPSGSVIASQDITITKDFIEETSIDPDSLVFEWVSDSEKEKIEKLKWFLSKLPQQQKLQAMNYVQKLQENWNDNTEKTRTILDFENYIFELGLEDEDEIIALLESLLVEWQEDQSAKQITYTALVNLIPQDIECPVESGTCYDSMLSKLEDIRNSDDVEYNKTLGKEILEVVWTTESMTNSQKLDFKAILTSLVYGGNIESIPEEEKQEVIAEDIPIEESSASGGSKILSLLLTILKWIGILIGVFILLVAALYVLYLLFNKDKTIGFSEFVGNITSFGKNNTTTSSQQDSETEDILAEFNTSQDEEKDTSSDILSGATDTDTNAAKDITDIQVKDDVLSQPWKNEDVPDWLKGNFSPESSEDKDPASSNVIDTAQEKTQDDISLNAWDEDVPDWLKAAESKAPQEKKDTTPESTIQDTKKDAPKQEKTETLPESSSTDTLLDVDAETKIDENNIPDWLKWAADFSEKEPQNVTEDVVSEWKDTKTTEIPEPQKNKVSLSESKNTQALSDKTLWDETTIDENNVPDWLKGSFDSPTDDSVTDESAQEDVDTWAINTKQNPKQETQKQATQKKETKQNEVQEIKKDEKQSTLAVQEQAQKKKKSPKDKPQKDSSNTASPTKDKKEEELWDDGMKIPDWLKSDE